MLVNRSVHLQLFFRYLSFLYWTELQITLSHSCQYFEDYVMYSLRSFEEIFLLQRLYEIVAYFK